MHESVSFLTSRKFSVLTRQIWLLNNLSPYILKLRHTLDYLTLIFISLNYSFTCSISLALQAAFYYLLRFFFRFTYCGSCGKKSAHSAGDRDSIPASGGSPGEGNGNPFQYSCLENSMDRGVWQATVHGVAQSWSWLSDWHLTWQFPLLICSYSFHIQNFLFFH